MDFLTIDYIRQHSRIDYDCENELLVLYGNAAEAAVLNILNTTLADLKAANGGTVPEPIVQAALMLTENSYQHRSPAEATNLSTVPYTFDLLIKPYMQLI